MSTPLISSENPFQIELIQSIQHAQTPSDVIRLERIMNSYLNQLKTKHHHRQQGWSEARGRWHRNENINKLQQYYWKTLRDCDDVKEAIDNKRDKIQRECTHKWEYDPTDRDERTRYICALCGKWR